jgi:hypothetical protein
MISQAGEEWQRYRKDRTGTGAANALQWLPLFPVHVLASFYSLTPNMETAGSSRRLVNKITSKQ